MGQKKEKFGGTASKASKKGASEQTGNATPWPMEGLWKPELTPLWSLNKKEGYWGGGGKNRGGHPKLRGATSDATKDCR